LGLTDANELVAEIHDRIPPVLAAGDYNRWLSDEADPRDLIRPFPSESMRIWPISKRVNKPENDDPSVVEPIALSGSAFDERCRIHDLMIEGIGLALRKRGYSANS